MYQQMDALEKEDKSKKDDIFVWSIQSSNFGGCQATESSNKNCFLLMVNLIVLEVDHHGKKDVDLQRWWVCIYETQTHRSWSYWMLLILHTIWKKTCGYQWTIKIYSCFLPSKGFVLDLTIWGHHVRCLYSLKIPGQEFVTINLSFSNGSQNEAKRKWKLDPCLQRKSCSVTWKTRRSLFLGFDFKLSKRDRYPSPKN